jgi:hypothetical protein
MWCHAGRRRTPRRGAHGLTRKRSQVQTLSRPPAQTVSPIAATASLASDLPEKHTKCPQEHSQRCLIWDSSRSHPLPVRRPWRWSRPQQVAASIRSSATTSVNLTVLPRQPIPCHPLMRRIRNLAARRQHGRTELVGRGALAHKGARASLRGGHADPCSLQGGEHHHLDLGQALADAGGGLDPVKAGHAPVHQDHLWA